MTEPLILPIRADQIPQAAHAMASAFAEAPRFRFLVPRDEQRQAKLRWYWEAVMRACLLSGGVVHTALEKPGGLVQGVAIWDSPAQRPYSVTTLLRSSLWSTPVRLGIPAWLRRRSLSSVLAALESPQPCWYLNAIGVDPSAQRGGLGSALLNRMLARVDEDALPAFLDTSAPDNLGYYERFGFRVTAESTLPNGIPLWGMTRLPRHYTSQQE
ncbi:MAG: GNAT family N-acetyltransferase [Chloroflexi bacterium]|nr:GNAT family N-acetyltransferase [Chloroflexota bacterium]